MKLFLLQLYVQAVDGGRFRSTSTATITVNVNRNQFPPVWINSPSNTYPYSASISYRNTFPAEVMQVLAVDNRDVFNIVSYRFSTDSLTAKYFRIENDGRVFLQDSLQNAEVSTRTQFVVSFKTIGMSSFNS